MERNINISKFFTIRQLMFHKTSESVKVGDLALLGYVTEPTVYNNYTRKKITTLIYITRIETCSNDTIYHFTSFENGHMCKNCVIPDWQIQAIIPINVSDKDYEAAKIKYEKKIAKEQEKLRIEKLRQEEALEAERLRKEQEAIEKENAIRIAEEKELARKNETMVITVGMWEELMSKISELKSTVSELEGTVNGLRHHCYGTFWED